MVKKNAENNYLPGEKIGNYGVWVNDLRGKKDTRNKLNNLTGKEWISKTSSVWEFEKDCLKESVINILQMFTHNEKKENILIYNNQNRVTDTVLFKSYSSIQESIPTFKIHNLAEIANVELSQTYQLSLAFIDSPTINLTEVKQIANLFYKKTSINQYSIVITKEILNENVLLSPMAQIIEEFHSNGFTYHGKITTFSKNSLSTNLNNDYYYILIFYKGTEDKKKNQSQKHYYPIHLQFPLDDSLEYPIIQYSTTKTDNIGKIHPATFSYLDIQSSIETFVGANKHALILDPFGGVASTAIAAELSGNKSILIELNPDYVRLMRDRLEFFFIWEAEVVPRDSSIVSIDSAKHFLIEGDSTQRLTSEDIPELDYCITSPPYHNILRNNGHGVRHDESQFRQGIQYYSEEVADLGNQENFEDYLNLHELVMKSVYIKLKKNAHCSIVISDFTINKKEIDVSGEIINQMVNIGFNYIGTTTLVQSQKVLYPFGYPFKFIINHTNQYIINFKK